MVLTHVKYRNESSITNKFCPWASGQLNFTLYLEGVAGDWQAQNCSACVEEVSDPDLPSARLSVGHWVTVRLASIADWPDPRLQFPFVYLNAWSSK